MVRASEPLKLLSDATRIRILHLLADQPLTVAELQQVLDLGQSSVSGHLAKLKHAGFIHDLAEGSARRYRLREDLIGDARAVWQAVSGLSDDDPLVASDRERLAAIRHSSGATWVERVAGTLHREYAPGRTWHNLAHALLEFVVLGRCVDVGAGDGAMVELLAPRAQELICVDPSPAMVEAGRARVRTLGLERVRYLQSSAEAMNLAPDSCDSALFLQSLQYIADPRAALERTHQVLKPGGRIAVLTLAEHDYDESRHYGHLVQGFSQSQLRAWLADFTDLRIYPLEPEPTSPRYRSLVATARK